MTFNDVQAMDEESTQVGVCKEPGEFRFLEIAAFFIFAIGPLVGNAVIVLFGPIAADFVVDPTVVMIAIPSFMFPFAFIQMFSGAISDVYGRVPVIVVGLATFAIGLILIFLAPTIEIFALGNIVSGAGFGFVNPVILALLSDCSDPVDIPKRMGVATALTSLSVGFGPFIASQMVVFGWQSYYLLFLILVILGSVGIVVAKRPTRAPVKSGVQLLKNNLGIELRRPVVLLMLVTTFLISLVYRGTSIWTSRGLTGVYDTNTIGLLLLAGGIAGVFSGGILGPMIGKYGYKLPIALGLATLFSGLSLFIIIGDITLLSSLSYVLLGLIIVSWAGGLLFPLMITFSQVFSPERRGVLAGVVTFAFFLGFALIPSIYEPLFTIGIEWVFIGIFCVTIALLFIFASLYKRIDSSID